MKDKALKESIKRLEYNDKVDTRMQLYIVISLSIMILISFIFLSIRIDHLQNQIDSLPHKVCHNETIMHIPYMNYTSEGFTWGLCDSQDKRMKELMARCYPDDGCFIEQKEVCEMK